MNRKNQAQLIEEWKTQGTSYRKLAVKYKSNSSTVHRMIKRQKKKQEEEQLIVLSKQTEAMSDDVEALKKALRQALLKIELQDLMIDISSKELGVDLRKKHGAKQSK